MRSMNLNQVLQYIKNNPSSSDIQVAWEDDNGMHFGRLRNLSYDQNEQTVTIKTTCTTVTVSANLVKFSCS